MGKKLASLILTGALALGSAGCGTDLSEYAYDGMINGDKVEFVHSIPFRKNYPDNTLTVKKPDGRIIVYYDIFNDDLQIEEVTIEKTGEATKRYSIDNELENPIMQKAQEQFDEYLKQIGTAKLNEGLESLK